MPSGDEMYRILNALDLTYKSEMILVRTFSIPNDEIHIVSTALDYLLDQHPRNMHLPDTSDSLFRGARQARNDLADIIPFATRWSWHTIAPISAQVP